MSSRELRACGRHGHITYEPTEVRLAARLRAETPLGAAWRCLRCGDWVLDPHPPTGPAHCAPVPARGRALRQLTILRVLAVERVFRAVVLLAAAYGVYRFASAELALRNSFGHLLPAAQPLATRLGVDLDQSSFVQSATKALHTGRTTLTLVSIGLALYGVLEGSEGVGLWLGKRWAEYLTVVATAAFLPLEIHELLKTVTITKVAAFLINVAAVVYLIVAKRLFGLRGGTAEYERQMQGESLFEVEDAGEDPHYDAGLTAGSEVGVSSTSAGTVTHPTDTA